MAKPAPVCVCNPSLERLLVPITGLSADPENARKHGPRSYDGIVASLAKFGQMKPRRHLGARQPPLMCGDSSSPRTWTACSMASRSTS
jgi:hypothetical protein